MCLPCLRLWPLSVVCIASLLRLGKAAMQPAVCCTVGGRCYASPFSCFWGGLGLLSLSVKGAEVASMTMNVIQTVPNLDWLSVWIKAYAFVHTGDNSRAINTIWWEPGHKLWDCFGGRHGLRYVKSYYMVWVFLELVSVSQPQCPCCWYYRQEPPSLA